MGFSMAQAEKLDKSWDWTRGSRVQTLCLPLHQLAEISIEIWQS